MTIDFTKPVQTRDGRKVRILCTDAPCVYYDTPQPIVGIIEGNTFPASWCVDGSYALGSYHNNDLISASAQKKKALVTVRLYRCPQQGVYPAVAIEGQPHPWLNDFIAQKVVELEYEEDSSHRE